MRCMPDWESCEPLISSVRENLNAIWASKFVPLDEYRRRVESGRLAASRPFHGDRAFQKAHPDHPLAGDNRYARIKAADAIRDAAKQINRPLSDDILADIHKALFDCCAPVRHSLAQALFFIGSPKSARVVERLLDTEPESNMVRSSARVALERCRMRDPAGRSSTDRVVMAVTADLDLVDELLGVCEKHSARLHLPDPPFDDLVSVHGQVHVIDRWYMGKDIWGVYCDHLDKVAAGDARPTPTVDRQASLLQGSAQDTTPLIITDWRMERSSQEFRSPDKPADLVFMVEGGPTDVVSLIVKKVLQGVTPIDFAAVIWEVNAGRLARR